MLVSMNNEIIRDLYINYVGTGENSRKCYLLFDRIEHSQKDLMQILHKKNRKKLEQICEDFEERKCIETEEAFIRGFSFAVQLLGEAYSKKL